MAEKKNDRERDLVGLDNVEVAPLTDEDLESISGGAVADTNNAQTGCITNNASTGCPITPGGS
jgi:hypothetical protein